MYTVCHFFVIISNLCNVIIQKNNLTNILKRTLNNAIPLNVIPTVYMYMYTANIFFFILLSLISFYEHL